MKRALPLFGLSLMAGGLVIVAVLAWHSWQPQPPPYSYQLVGSGKAAEFPELGLADLKDLAVRKFEVRIDGVDEPLAELHVAEDEPGRPVLLQWNNRLNEPVITLTSPMAETVALTEAIKKHAPKDATILAWWDLSLRLKLLTGGRMFFTDNLAKPLLVPSIWAGRELAIADLERAFWKTPAADAPSPQLDKFVDALLSDEVVGTAKLRQLVGERETYLVLHISDVYKIGAMAPDRFAVGFQDFAKTGQLHAMAKRIKTWVEEEGHKAYTVTATNDQVRRVFFLADDVSKETLLARMLPFDTSNPFKITGPRVVFQHGGYWVYKLPEARTATKQ